MPDTASLAEVDAEPHAELFADGPRTVRLALDAGAEMPPHSHPGFDVLVHVVAGELAVTVDDEDFELEAGELLRFDGDSGVSPAAREDAVAVVVFAPTE